MRILRRPHRTGRPEGPTDDVVVVSGSYGAGHDAAAAALVDQLRAEGHRVSRLDVAEELPWRLGVVLRSLYLLQLRLLPGSWGATLRCLEGDGRTLRAVRRLLGLLGRPLAGRVDGARLVVCTHPFAAQALGEARAGGSLDTPVVTYLTDASVHRLWVHGAVDLHLAIHDVAARQARALGGRSCVVSPVVGRSPARPTVDWTPPWPAERPAALVVGGSWGIGDLAATALDVLATGLMTPVVACGANEALRAQLGHVPGVVALGWRDDLPLLAGEAACVLQNAGGMTALESLAAGTTTLTYRPIPGHGTTNADALDRAGLVPWLRDHHDLEAALLRIMVKPRRTGLPVDAPRVVDALEVAGLLHPVGLPVAA